MNLQENIHRIKQVMGLNEQSSGYIDDEPEINNDTDNPSVSDNILSDVKYAGKSDDGNLLLSITFNVKTPEGSGKVTTLSKWQLGTSRLAGARNARCLNSKVVDSTFPLGDSYKNAIESSFSFSKDLVELMDGLYTPKYIDSYKKTGDFDNSIKKDMNTDMMAIYKILTSIEN